MHRDQRLGELAQRRRRDAGAAGERPGAALGRDLPGQHAAGRPRPRRRPPPAPATASGTAGDAHHALDAGLLRAGADRAGVGAPAEEQAERGHDHGLAGAGLAGDRGEPGPELEHGLVDDAEGADPQLLKHRAVTSAGARSAAPRQPVTGRSNFATSRSVKGASCSRASRTGAWPRRTSIRAPGGRSTVRRPSHHSTPAALGAGDHLDRQHRVRARPPSAGRRARARRSAPSAAPRPRARRSGPPAEKLYAVEPVGVEQTTPSQPHRDSGRPSTSTTTSSIRSRAAFSTLASLSAQVRARPAPCRGRPTTSIVSRSSAS